MRIVALFAGLALALGAGAADVTVRIGVLPGLKYDPTRFAVAPGDRVTVEFHNGDEMIHNFVVTAPGERLKVVSAALTLGADGPGRNFVPALREVLWSTRALNPGENTRLTFTAPSEEAVYPYVCTFPGHGFVMYGAMYVTRGALPPIESDPNVPPVAAAAAEVRDGLLKVGERPMVSRTFLPDCGPAAVAVGLPGGQSYCFDAGACRLRYAWKGGFVDNTDQWDGKGDLWSKVVGRIYYRAPPAPWLRLGTSDHIPEPRWHGYRLIDGYPEFHYTLDGVDVRELIRPRTGGGGLEISFTIPSASGRVYLVVDQDGGAAFTSSTGRWSPSAGTRSGPGLAVNPSVLALNPDEAAHFTITLAERPGVEPLAYWSMNDALWSSEEVPKPGVVGRAFTPGGLDRETHVLDSGIRASALKGGGTLMAWVQAKAGDDPAPVFSAGRSFAVPAPARDGHWHHLVVTFPGGGGGGILYVDGSDRGEAGISLPAQDADFEIGSAGGRFLSGLIDEVRIYDRVLPPSEIKAIYRREAAAGNLIAQ